MITLSEYITDINESTVSQTAFKNHANDINELKNFKTTDGKKLYIFDEKYVNSNIISTLLYKIAKHSGENTISCMYSDQKRYIKLPYLFKDAIIRSVDEMSADFSYTLFGSNKVKVKINDGSSNSPWLFETGSGSGKSTPVTSQQEIATCEVWNMYRDELDTIDTSKEKIDELSGRLSNIFNFKKDWLVSFIVQVNAMRDALKSMGISNSKIKRYKAVRFGVNSDPVSDAYSKFVNAYSKMMDGAKKDVYDPSDIILYAENELETILNKLHGYMQDPVGGKVKYMEDLFNTRLLMGISLKKIGRGSGEFDIYNDGSDVDRIPSNVKNITVTPHVNGKSITITCTGNFRFDNTTVVDNEGDNPVGRERMITIKMRTFGSGQVAMDCSINDTHRDPTIGKCPISIWSNVFGIKRGTDIETCVKMVNRWYKWGTANKINKGVIDIIRGAIKWGPSCFPFILIH